MVQIDRSWSLFGICIFVVAALIAPFFTHSDYDWVQHTIGELAGQQMPNAWIMRVGYVSLGFGVFFDALQMVVKRRRDYIAFIIFGLCLIGAVAFNQRSIDPKNFFAAPLAHWHGFFFVFAGLSLVVGIGMRFFHQLDWQSKTINATVIVIVLATGPLTVLLPQFAGVFERLALIASLAWLACFFHPKRA